MVCVAFLVSEVAEFFFVDTTPFVDKYFTEPGDHVYDWRGIGPRKTYISNLLKVLPTHHFSIKTNFGERNRTAKYLLFFYIIN